MWSANMSTSEDKRIDSRLLGRWVSDQLDGDHTSMEFLDDGSLTYTIHGKSSNQIMFLTYRTEGDVIVSNQPSKPKEERTHYMFSADGKLMLLYGSQFATFSRA